MPSDTEVPPDAGAAGPVAGSAAGPAALETLLAQISDASAKPEVTAKYHNAELHARALLRAVYEDKRARERNQLHHTIYLDNYSAKELEARPFINFGPGNFRHRFWQTADKIYVANGGMLWSESRGKSFREKIDYEWDMYRRQPLAVDDGVFEIAYASHIVEHAYDDDDAFFFRDVCRILKPGGVFRLTAPDIDLGLRAMRKRDYSYYGQGQFLRGGVHREAVFGPRAQRKPIEWFVLENCSLLVHNDNSTCLTPEECIAFLASDPDVYKTLDRASELSDRSLNEKLAVHVNWFNPAKIARMLKAAGFSEVLPSSYGQSVSPVLRDVRHFDNTNPSVSWYIDAIK